MSNSFNINVSGGNVAFGAAAQGDHGSVSGSATQQVTLEAGSRAMQQQIDALAAQAGVAPEAQAAAKDQAKALAQAVAAKDTSTVATALALAQKNFSWAYPALKDFVKVAWPALLAVIGA